MNVRVEYTWYIHKRYSFDPKIADVKQGGGQFYFNLIKLHWK